MRISVVTPTLNSARFVRNCVDNVASQGPCVIEHLIVDGGSDDGTLQLVEELRRSHPALRLIQGPDRGQSDAMNKGTLAALGEVIGVLNVDDTYEPGACAEALALLEAMRQPGMVVGDCRVVGEQGEHRFWNRPTNLRLEALLLGWSYAQFPCNPSAYFYHREVHDLAGGYDVDDHFSMDFDFILNCACRVEMRYVPRHWGNFRLAPGCKTFDDGNGKQRVAALIARHRARLGWLGAARMRLLKARIDFHRFRRATGLPTRAARTPS